MRWEFNVDAEQIEPSTRVTGFVPARAVVPIRPEPTEWQRAHRGEAGLFAIDSFHDAVDLLRATLGDASAEISLFGTRDGDASRSMTELSGEQRPELHELLRPDEIFVDITIGVDLGYHDSIMIASAEDHRPALQELVADLERRIETYEERVPRIETMEQFLSVLGESLGI